MSEQPPVRTVPAEDPELEFSSNDLNEEADEDAPQYPFGDEDVDQLDSEDELWEKTRQLTNYLDETGDREEAVLQERYGTNLMGRTKRWLNTTRAGAITGSILNYTASASMVLGGSALGAATGPVSLLLAPTLYALGIKKGFEQLARHTQEVVIQNRRRIEMGTLRRDISAKRELASRTESSGIDQIIELLEQSVELTKKLEERQLQDFEQSQRERFRASVAGSVASAGVSIMTGVPLGAHDLDHDKVTHAVRLGRRGLEFVYNAGEHAANGVALTGSHILGHGFARSIASAGVAATTLLVSPWRRYQEMKATQPKESNDVAEPGQPKPIEDGVRRGLAGLGMVARNIGYIGYVASSIPILAFDRARRVVGIMRDEPRLTLAPPPHIADRLARERRSGTTDSKANEELPPPGPPDDNELGSFEVLPEAEDMSDQEKQVFERYLAIPSVGEYDRDSFTQLPKRDQASLQQSVVLQKNRHDQGRYDEEEAERARRLAALLEVEAAATGETVRGEMLGRLVDSQRRQYLDFVKLFKVRIDIRTTARAYWYDSLSILWDRLPEETKQKCRADEEWLENELAVAIQNNLFTILDYEYYYRPDTFDQTPFMIAAKDVLAADEFAALADGLKDDPLHERRPDLIMKVYTLYRQRHATDVRQLSK